MPVAIIMHTSEEVIQIAKQLSEEIVRLANVEETPLMPGETVDTRRHQIASLGKKLAEAFLAIDRYVSAIASGSTDVTANPPKPSDEGAN
jgi:hypothetical protein